MDHVIALQQKYVQFKSLERIGKYGPLWQDVSYRNCLFNTSTIMMFFLRNGISCSWEGCSSWIKWWYVYVYEWFFLIPVKFVQMLDCYWLNGNPVTCEKEAIQAQERAVEAYFSSDGKVKWSHKNLFHLVPSKSQSLEPRNEYVVKETKRVLKSAMFFSFSWILGKKIGVQVSHEIIYILSTSGWLWLHNPTHPWKKSHWFGGVFTSIRKVSRNSTLGLGNPGSTAKCQGRPKLKRQKLTCNVAAKNVRCPTRYGGWLKISKHQEHQEHHGSENNKRLENEAFKDVRPIWKISWIFRLVWLVYQRLQFMAEIHRVCKLTKKNNCEALFAVAEASHQN